MRFQADQPVVGTGDLDIRIVRVVRQLRVRRVAVQIRASSQGLVREYFPKVPDAVR